MARPRKITVEQILNAAQAIFLEKGFGASTQEIATKAGISEGSIFKRFATKEELFIAAMGASKISSVTSFIEATAGQDDLRENLKKIGLEMVDFIRELLPRMMMVRSKGVPLPPMLMQPSKAPPVRVVKALTELFEQEISLGRMRCSHPETIAMMFLGAVMQYVFFVQASAQLPDAEVYIDSVVDVFWGSIQPNDET
ncbi:MAG: TetR/AcrR family transcriptional regulator [Cyanobacteria bacterium P01_D01_bin.115]